MRQLEVTLPSRGCAPPWHWRHVSIAGIATSCELFERETSWHSVQRVRSCVWWSNRACGIHRLAARTGATLHASGALAAAGESRCTSWHVLQTRTSKRSAATARALREARRNAFCRSAGVGSPTRRNSPSPLTPKAFWKLSGTPRNASEA